MGSVSTAGANERLRKRLRLGKRPWGDQQPSTKARGVHRRGLWREGVAGIGGAGRLLEKQMVSVGTGHCSKQRYRGRAFRFG